QGIIHRDIKASNMLWDSARDEAKLTDFGVAGRLGATRSAVGTPVFMAPEALLGHATEASDVYGLAVTLFHLITGELPFPATTVGEAISARRKPDQTEESFRQIPQRLEGIIRAGLAPAQADRPSLPRFINLLWGALNRMDRPNMALRVEKPAPPAALVLLRHCYRFVNEDWQHLARDESADQGFEMKLRESCLKKLDGWVVSQQREMNLAMGLTTASGVLHEVDVVAQREPTVGILELKNRADWRPEKNDVIVFFAKILDYLCLTPALLRSYLVPIFASSHPFERSA